MNPSPNLEIRSVAIDSALNNNFHFGSSSEHTTTTRTPEHAENT